jgi:hypothetical protein
MNEVYNLVMNGATDPFEKVLMLVLFFMVIEALFSLITLLISKGVGR